MNNEKMQAAIDRFLKDPYWKGIYEGASEKCKQFYDQNFAYSLQAVDPKEHTEATIAVYKELDASDWDYLISHSQNNMCKWGLKQAREKYGKKENS